MGSYENNLECAIILAAGLSSRTRPTTDNTPKPLLRILDKTLLEHNLEQLQGIVDNVIIVIGFMGDTIKKRIGNRYGSIDITYVEQKEQHGTGHALTQCNFTGRVLILMGDDLYSRKDMLNLIKYPSSVLVSHGYFDRFDMIYRKFNSLHSIEKSNSSDSGEVNTGCYVVDSDILNLGYYSNLLPDLINMYSAKKEVRVVKVVDYWIPVTYWWNYLQANQFMLKKRGEAIYVHETANVLKSANLRKGSIIFDNVTVGGEVVDSVIMENTKAKHNCYIGHSVIGRNCNIGAGTITSDYRHDGKEHNVRMNAKVVKSRRKKLGACLGDNVNTGINTSIYPGRRIFSNMTTLPGEIVKEDKL